MEPEKSPQQPTTEAESQPVAASEAPAGQGVKADAASPDASPAEDQPTPRDRATARIRKTDKIDVPTPAAPVAVVAPLVVAEKKPEKPEAPDEPATPAEVAPRSKPLADLSTAELKERTEQLTALREARKKERELAADELDDRISMQAKQQKYFETLLAATQGKIPELFSKAGEGLREMLRADKPLTLDGKLNFTTAAEAMRVPAYASLALDATADFFGMNDEDKAQLYQRVGLFKGIVIDHRQENTVEQGFRDVLKFVPPAKAGAAPAAADKAGELAQPVSIFYRKPRLSGFFESAYATDEFQRKTQQIGIHSLSFGGSVSYAGPFASATASGGHSRSTDKLDEAVKHTNRVTITTSFFLPKIELSFDMLTPCASDGFSQAVSQVFEQPAEKQFDALLAVLQQFGHFVASNLVVGGRLYTSEEKKAANSTVLKNELTQSATHLQAAVSAWRVTAGGQYEQKDATTNNSNEATTTENQNMELQAVGGEGAYVSNTGEWVKSLAKYTAWALVRFDKLVPSISVLPTALYQHCQRLLAEVVASPSVTIESLREKNAHFLFYEGYLEAYGSRVQPRYVVLKGAGPDRKVLTLVNNSRLNDAEVALKPYEGGAHQQWWLALDGKICARSERDDPEQFVLSLGGTGSDKLVVTQNNYFPNQVWRLGGGMLRNESNGKYLSIGSDNTLSVVDEKAILNSRNAWQALSSEQLDRPRRAQARDGLVGGDDSSFTALYDNQTLRKGQKLVSRVKGAELTLADNALTIKRHGEQLWHKELSPPSVPLAELMLKDGRLLVTDAQQNVYYLYGTIAGVPRDRGDVLELLENGNLELLNLDGAVVWESNSIIYSVVQYGSADAVLSVHHTAFAPDMEPSVIRLTTMPFVGADHQLWYLNSNQQLVCKAMRGQGSKLAVACHQDGSVSVDPISYTTRSQRWLVGTRGKGPILNDEWRQKSLAPDKNGRILIAHDGTQADWSIVPQSIHYTRHKCLMKLRFNREAGSPYVFLSDKKSQYVHLHMFPLSEKPGAHPLQGFGLKWYDPDNKDDGARVAIKAQVQGEEIASKEWDTGRPFEAFKKEAVYVDSAPVYLPTDLTALGLRKKLEVGNKPNFYALLAKNGDKEYANYDEGHALKLYNSNGLSFLDTGMVEAAAGERVVGIGFAASPVYPDRLAPYLLVIKEEKLPAQ